MKNKEVMGSHSFCDDVVFTGVMVLAGIVGISCITLAGRVGMMVVKYAFGLFSILLLGLGTGVAMCVVVFTFVFMNKGDSDHASLNKNENA